VKLGLKQRILILVFFTMFFSIKQASARTNEKENLAIPSLPIGLTNMGYATVNKKIYIAGGYTAYFSTSDQLYIYDQKSNQWSLGAEMPTSRYDLVLVHAGNNIYAIGGHEYKGTRFAENEMYNIKENKWYTKKPMPIALEDMEAAAVGEKIYIIGGTHDKGYSDQIYSYNTITDQWTDEGKAPFISEAMGITVLEDKIHIIGGGKTLNEHWVFDPEKKMWEQKNALPTARSHFVAFTYNNHIYTLGGTIGRGLFVKPLKTIEVYDPKTDQWESHSGLSIPRSRFAYGVIDQNVYLIGGWTDVTFDDRAEILSLN